MNDEFLPLWEQVCIHEKYELHMSINLLRYCRRYIDDIKCDLSY